MRLWALSALPKIWTSPGMLVGSDFLDLDQYLFPRWERSYISALHAAVIGQEVSKMIIYWIYIILDKYGVTYIVICFIPGYI